VVGTRDVVHAPTNEHVEANWPRGEAVGELVGDRVDEQRQTQVVVTRELTCDAAALGGRARLRDAQRVADRPLVVRVRLNNVEPDVRGLREVALELVQLFNVAAER